MKLVDPTYLRTIVDGLSAAKLQKDNPANLPQGLIGIYEEALPPTENVNERKRFLDFFTVWALLKREVSVTFVTELLEDWTEEDIVGYINKYSKWFNSPVSGLYTLYHERLRTFLLQKVSHQQFIAFNNSIIKRAQAALDIKSNDEWEYYSLEYLSTHLIIPALESGDANELKALSYNTAHWNRQIEISKRFDWSKRMLDDMMLWASKYDDDEVIECALNKVDLYHLEQNDAPRIVELVANNYMHTALQRIEAFGGNDKEGLQRKFILYMLCLMELTLLESKDKSFRKEAIDKLLKHLDNHLPVDYSVLDWDNFFPSYLMFQIACEWAEMGLDYLIVYKRASRWENEWIEEKGPYSDSQFKTLSKFLKFKEETNWNYDSNKKILNELLKQGKVDFALELVGNIIDINEKNESIVKIARLLISKNDLDRAYKIIDELIEMDVLPEVQRELVEEFILKDDLVNAVSLTKKITHKFYKICALCSINTKYIQQGENAKADAALKYAIELTAKIQNNSWKLMALRKIALECINENRFTDADKFINESFTWVLDTHKDNIKYWGINAICILFARKQKLKNSLDIATKINELFFKDKALINISIESAKIGKFKDAKRIANYISNQSDKSHALREISVGLAKHAKFDEAIKCAATILDRAYNADNKIVKEMLIHGKVKKAITFTQSITIFWHKCNILQEITSFLAKSGKIKEANNVFLQLCNLSIDDTLTQSLSKSIALTDISIEMSKIGNEDKSFSMMQEALKYAIFIEDFDDKSRATYKIYYALAENEKINNLKKIMLLSLNGNNVLTKESLKSMTLEYISIELAKKGDVKKSLELAKAISDDSEKISILIGIQKELNKVDRIEQDKLSAINEALKCIRFLKNNKNKITLILDIATELNNYKKTSESVTLIHEAIKYTQQLIDNNEKSDLFSKISTGLEKNLKIQEASLIMNQAFEFSLKILDNTDKFSNQKNLSFELAKQRKFENAIKCANNIDDIYCKCDAIKGISVEMAKCGNIINAIKLAREIIDNSERSRALSIISTVLAQQGKSESSSSIFQEALKSARNISNDDFFKGEVLYEISYELVKQGKLEEALDISKEIIEDLFHSFALQEISKKYAEQGKWAFAEITGLNIRMCEQRYNCWKSISNQIYTENNLQSTFQYVNQIKNAEAKIYFLKGLADSIKSIDANKQLILNFRYYYKDDIESMEKILQQHALHELFFKSTNKDKIERLSRTLNIQWAIDIDNSIRKN
jgi:hypothetical protein